MNPQCEEAEQLLTAGQRDRTAFRIWCRDTESPVEIILFHAQQGIEKFIKAALVRNGVVFRRTRDLLELKNGLLNPGSFSRSLAIYPGAARTCAPHGAIEI